MRREEKCTRCVRNVCNSGLRCKDRGTQEHEICFLFDFLLGDIYPISVYYVVFEKGGIPSCIVWAGRYQTLEIDVVSICSDRVGSFIYIFY